MADMNDSFFEDIKNKIAREQKLIQGFQALKKKTSNSEVIQRCNAQIRETQSNLDYLHETLSKLTLQKQTETETGTVVSDPPVASSRPSFSRLDLIKYDCPSLGHRIQYMLQQLQFKLQVENQYREANEKISHLYALDGDNRSSSAAEGGRIESDQRIQLLNKALKRYQDMHISVEEVARDTEILNTPQYARKPLSGTLKINVTCIRDVDHIASPMFSKRAECFISMKVDDVERAKTKTSRTDRWNEEFNIDIDKGNEIEFTVYDKSGNHNVPVAVTWILLSDVTEELRKKRAAQDMGSAGWISASNMPMNPAGGPGSNGLGSNGGGSGSGNGSASGSSNGYGFDTADADVSTIGADDASTETSQQVTVSNWFMLEPVGQVLITMSFSKHSLGNNSKGGLNGGLGRHGAIRQKKEEVFEQHGHQFVQKQFYNIMCCALCGDFLRYTGFQCQDCRFLCHKKCYQKVVTKCISKSSADIDPDEAKLNHRIPHRFEAVSNRGTKWCCHCGYILPWGRKNVRKCSECGVMCHANCTHLVPDFCGMSMEMANRILTTIKATKPRDSQSTASTTAVNTIRSSRLPPTPQKKPIGANAPSTESTTPRASYEKQLPHPQEEFIQTQLPTHVHNKQQSPQNMGRRPPPPQPTVTKQPVEDEEEEEAGNYTFVAGREEANRFIPGDDILEDEKTLNNAGEDFAQFDYQSTDYNHQMVVPPTQVQEPIPQQQVGTITGRSRKSHDGAKRRHRRKVGLDDFQFLAVLGKGNFGKVMLAESRHTKNLCAIKVLKKDFIIDNDEAESVKSEKRVFLTANREKHPFLLNLHCCFQTENRIYFVMEYVSGGDLMWHIQKARFSSKRAKFYASEVLLALKYFHENGIVYRDLKLDNILLTTNGHIKIADYGLCKEEMWHGNTTGTFCGTPEFMAPEIIQEKPYGRAVDWWAFGILLFQMLLCQSPFKGEDEDEIFNAIEHDDVKYPINMPRTTVLILQALLTKDPSQRLGSGQRDAEEIMEHAYFQDVDFDDVFNCRIPPPYVPEVKSEHDYSNFDKEFTSETPRLTPVETILTSEMQEQFRGFSHVSDDTAV